MSKVEGRRASVLLLLLLLLALVCAPREASAHAKIKRSEPKANSTVARAPGLVELWFTEAMQEGFTTIEVTDSKRRRLDRGPVTLSEGGTKAQVELEELEPGTYTVAWKILSKDQHTIRGRFRFKVAAPAPTPTPTLDAATPAPAPQPPQAGTTESTPEPSPLADSEPGGDESATAGAEESPITWVDSLVRWLAYLAMVTLFGGFAARLFVLWPALRGDAYGALTASDRRTSFWLRASILLLWVTLILSLTLQSAAVLGVGFGEALSPSLAVRILTETGFGVSWLLAAGSAAALTALILLSGRNLFGLSRLLAGLAFSAALLAAPTLTGHASASAAEHRLAVLSDWLHLVAGAFWVGGLFHLALSAPVALRRSPPGGRAGLIAGLITRFTRVAVPSVAVVLLAGLYNAWLQVGTLGALPRTPYGRLLLVKVSIVLVMLLLGGLNSIHYGRRAAGAVGDESPEAAVRRGFLRTVGLEAVLGVLVLLATAALVFQTPARNYATGADAKTNEPNFSRSP
jgi:copper transport protein